MPGTARNPSQWPVKQCPVQQAIPASDYYCSAWYSKLPQTVIQITVPGTGSDLNQFPYITVHVQKAIPSRDLYNIAWYSKISIPVTFITVSGTVYATSTRDLYYSVWSSSYPIQ